MLPGHGKDKQQAALPAHVSAEFSRSLHWLGETSNHRLETRHASHGTLWPNLNLIERRDFIHDADLVIRGVVEKELKIVALTKR